MKAITVGGKDGTTPGEMRRMTEESEIQNM